MNSPVTATVTAFDRIEQTIATIRRLQACKPPPDEIIVHVDAQRFDCASAIRTNFPDLEVLISESRVGPGGGRNRLMKVSRNDLVANFDDDSFPVDEDFFARAVTLFDRFPEVSVFAARIYHPWEAIETDLREIQPAGSFGGGGVVFRRKDLIEAGGYLPLPIAYGAEEEDIALRLFDRGRRIMSSKWLRVFHDTRLRHHSEPSINAQILANIGLIIYLRYPLMCWPLGLAQIGNRVRWCIRNRRVAGLFLGLWSMPSFVWRFRDMRSPVRTETIRCKRNAVRAHPILF